MQSLAIVATQAVSFRQFITKLDPHICVMTANMDLMGIRFARGGKITQLTSKLRRA